MASRTTTALRSAVLILRLLTLALLAASLALIAADKLTVDSDPPQRFTFKDVHAYRYVLAVAVVGCAYTLLHLPFAAASVARMKRLVAGSGSEDDVALLLIVCADVAFALLLAAGAAAGLGFTHDVKRYFDGVVFRGAAGGSPEVDRLHRDVDRFFDLAYASAGLMLAAAACTALMIMLSVYSLVK
ncbi:hypothetical protein GQ55_8G200300 [Panicum hallii var. hallii]|uniref:CASP-like protein n=1 Tax=Panicum hallii var. hallii TaxID=1504633 RepID=A0A2T7CPI1_9POAL|nr:hypothetical protein GQ55_8G200300 [Panicum hallii var. hallii]